MPDHRRVAEDRVVLDGIFFRRVRGSHRRACTSCGELLDRGTERYIVGVRYRDCLVVVPGVPLPVLGRKIRFCPGCVAWRLMRGAA